MAPPHPRFHSFNKLESTLPEYASTQVLSFSGYMGLKKFLYIYSVT